VTNTIIYNNNDNIRNYLNSTGAPLDGAVDISYSMTNDEEYDDNLFCISGTPLFDSNFYLLPESNGIAQGTNGTNMGLVDSISIKLGSIFVSEIMYAPSDSLDSGDWIELYNPQRVAQDISGWILADENNEHSYIIPDGTIVSPHSYFVLSRNIDSFNSYYPDIKNVSGSFNFGFGLADQVVLRAPKTNEQVDLVIYSNSEPWPEIAEQSGYSLSLKSINTSNLLPSHWRSSYQLGGTPGYQNADTSTFIKKPDYVPEKFELHQNFPNPFNNLTHIEFEISEPSFVFLDLFNVLGQKIKSLIKRKSYEKGVYNYSLTNDNLASGIYFYRLRVLVNGKIEFTETRKIALIK